MTVRLDQVISSELGTNTYILSCGGEAMVIDPGIRVSAARDKLDELGVVCTKVVLTHGHFDHAAAAFEFEKAGATVHVFETEIALNNARDSLAAVFRVPYTPYRPGVLLRDGDVIPFGGVSFSVMHTPGHTPGGICLIGPGVIFSGDTLFYEDVGRVDFPGGDAHALENSVRRIFALEGDYTVYPGHGSATDLSHERGAGAFFFGQ